MFLRNKVVEEETKGLWNADSVNIIVKQKYKSSKL